MEWFRFYDSTLDNVKVQSLSGELVKGWLNLLCLANSGNGVLPPVRVIAFRLRLSEPDAQALLQILLNEGLIDQREGYLEMHDWSEYQRVSDSSADRTRRYRERQTVKTIAQSTGEKKAKMVVTSQETSRSRHGDVLETEQNREEERDLSLSVESGAAEGNSPVLSEAKRRIQEAIEQTAAHLKARHPEIRCGLSQNAIQHKLQVLLKRQKVKLAQAPEFLAALDQRHERWCQFPQWRDKGGTYAKGLSNWLSARESLFLEEPPDVGSAPSNGKPATSFPREIYGQPEPMQRTAEEIELLREQANDPCEQIRQAARIALSEYQETTAWKN